MILPILSGFLDALSVFLVLAGLGFYLSSLVGLIRFEDIYCQLHVLTKADNLGLGLIVLAVALQASSWLAVIKLFFIWVFVLIASSGLSSLIAETHLNKQHKQPPRTHQD